MRGYFDNGRIYLDLEISGVFAKNRKTIKAQIDTRFFWEHTVTAMLFIALRTW